MTFIRKMQPADVHNIVEIHLAAFRNFFLSQLGPAFLRQLYLAILEDESGIAYVYTDPGKIAGFVAGTSQPQGLYRRLLRQRLLRFTLAALIPATKRPAILPRLFRAFKTPHQFRAPENSAVLMSIAVAPRAQGKGIGQALLWEFLQNAKSRNVNYVNLTTDTINNERVNRFYQQAGFILSSSFRTPEGREMNEYLYNLSNLDLLQGENFIFPS